MAETLALDGVDSNEKDDKNPVIWANEVASDFEVEADAEQLFRVLLNLSRNAVQAMEHKRIQQWFDVYWCKLNVERGKFI